MAHDWNGERTRRLVFVRRLTIAAPLALLVAIALTPFLSARGRQRDLTSMAYRPSLAHGSSKGTTHDAHAARTILILEDEPLIALCLQTMLEAAGFRNIEVIGAGADAETWWGIERLPSRGSTSDGKMARRLASLDAAGPQRASDRFGYVQIRCGRIKSRDVGATTIPPLNLIEARG